MGSLVKQWTMPKTLPALKSLEILKRRIGWAAKGYGGQFFDGEKFVTFKSEPGTHAEESLLTYLENENLDDAAAYVTLEPCTQRGKGTPCASRLISHGIKTVFIGNSDPHPAMSGTAWKEFHEANVKVRDFPADLRDEIRRDNLDFLRKFVYSPQETGGAEFNYMLNNGVRVLGPDGKQFNTKWSRCNSGSVYAYDHKFDVCIAKNCKHFDQIDDPSRWFEDKDYAKNVEVGQIVIYRNEHGYALIKIVKATYPDDNGNAILKFKYQLRYISQNSDSSTL
jgi:pyrimidine deaminase RibD-like protein